MKNILLPLAIVVSLVSCTAPKAEKKEEEKYTVTAPLVVDTTVTKEYVALIRSVRNIELRSQEKGFLQHIYVDEGQMVRRGQLLFKIMPNAYQAELLKAKAEAAAAEIEYQNAKALADKNIVSRNEAAVAKARLDQANAEVALAKLHLEWTDVRAPFDGTIDRIPLKEGTLVEEGELLTTLSDNSRMFAYFNVSEPEYLEYEREAGKRGSTQVALQLASAERYAHKGEVEVIESEFNSETGNIAFRATFPNPEKLLRHGETGKILMTVPLPGAMLIPQKATYDIQDKTFVYVVDEHQTLHSRELVVRHALPDLYVVSGGLAEGDRILLEGTQKAREGEKVSFTFESPEKVISHLKLKAE